MRYWCPQAVTTMVCSWCLATNPPPRWWPPGRLQSRNLQTHPQTQAAAPPQKMMRCPFFEGFTLGLLQWRVGLDCLCL